MKLYELTYLISPELSEEKLKSLSEEIITLIQERGGVLKEIKEPVRQKLAYPIKKRMIAFLTSLDFYLDPEKIEEIEKKIKNEGEILRHLILVKELPKAKVALPARKAKPRPLAKPEKKAEKKKIELKEIEKKLEEILGQ